MNTTTTLHGVPWKIEDINRTIEDQELRKQEWKRERWVPRDSLDDIHGGTSRLYLGHEYDKSKMRVIKSGWYHDHCEICWWTLFESEDPERSIGYTDGINWVCTECYEKFLKESNAAA